MFNRTRLDNQLTAQLQTRNARIRAKVEHPFRVITQLFGFTKVRYKGLAKNSSPCLR